MEQQDIEHRADSFASSSNSSAVLPEQTLNEVIKRHVLKVDLLLM